MKAIKTTIAQSGVSLYIKALIFGTITGCLSILLLMCILSLLLLITGVLPYDYLVWISLFISSIGVFISGYVSASITKEKGLFIGSLSGLIIFIIVFFSGMFISTETISFVTIIRLVVYMLIGALGGVKAVNKKDKLHIK